MAMTINTNVMSLTAQRNLSSTGSSLATSMQRLSSGLRVNSAKDDAAGLAIAERMNAQVRGMNVAIRNANDGVSLTQTAEGALGKIADSLQRMRELAVQSRNGTNSSTDRAALQQEVAQISAEIGRTQSTTNFNGTNIIQSATATTIAFQVGANNAADNRIDVSLNGVNIATALTANISTSAGADTALTAIDTALTTIATQRATYGALQSRLESATNTLQIASENISAASSRIMDADFAKETSNLARTQILQQAGTAMLAQANQSSQNVLKLLQ